MRRGRWPSTFLQGQRATLIIDTEEPFAYLAGNLTLRYDEQLAFVWLSAADLAGAAFRCATSVGGIHRRYGRKPALFPRAGGSYAADAGLRPLRAWTFTSLATYTAP
ncbi:MAG: hypothetical protein R2854_28290 [Caldilineaceae bacterium]